MPIIIYFLVITIGFLILIFMNYKNEKSLAVNKSSMSSRKVEGVAQITNKTLIEEKRMIMFLPPTYRTVHYITVEFEINHKTYKEDLPLREAININVGEKITVIQVNQKWRIFI